MRLIKVKEENGGEVSNTGEELDYLRQLEVSRLFGIKLEDIMDYRNKLRRRQITSKSAFKNYPTYQRMFDLYIINYLQELELGDPEIEVNT